MIRNPAVAGSFYYYDSAMLHRQIDDFVDKKARKENVIGVMSPHAGYIYSGKVAATVYSRVNPADTYVIMGPNHTGMGSDFSIMKDGVWRLPFGDVQIDKNLAMEIIVNSKNLEDDVFAHQHEHSIEVQIPFMQHFSEKFQIVPITIRHYPPNEAFLKMLEDIADAIAKAVKKTRERVVIVASTDLTHYESQETANSNDKAAIDAVLALDEKRLFDEIVKRDISMCGYGPTAVMIIACKKLGAKKAELVSYMTSGDVTKDYRQVVGYGGVIVK